MTNKLTNEEINKRVHTEIFGKCWCEWVKTSATKYGKYRCKHCKEFTNHPKTIEGKLNYAESIADAFKVVDELEKSGWIWTLSKNENEFAPAYDMRLFLISKDKRQPEKRAIAHGESPAKAICLASLQIE